MEDTSTYLGIVSSEVSPTGDNYTLKSYVNRDVVSSIEELESINSNVILIVAVYFIIQRGRNNEGSCSWGWERT